MATKKKHLSPGLIRSTLAARQSLPDLKVHSMSIAAFGKPEFMQQTLIF